MSCSLTSARIALAAALASAALVLAAPAMADQAVLPSAHHGQTSAQLPGPAVEQSSNGSSWNDMATVAAAALLGSGITLGAMTLGRRRDQPVSA